MAEPLPFDLGQDDSPTAQRKEPLPFSTAASASQAGSPSLPANDKESTLDFIGRELGNSIPGAAHVAALGDTVAQGLGAPKWLTENKADLSGKSFSDRYAANLAYQRARDAKSEQEHPYAAPALQIAGAMALPVGGATSSASRFLSGGLRSTLSDAGASALVGSGLGAAYGAGAANNVSDLPGDIVSGAEFGGIGGAAGHALGSGLGAIGSAIGKTVGFGSTDAAAQNEVASLAKRAIADNKSVLPPDQWKEANAMGLQPMVGDLLGEGGQRLARAVSNKSGEAAEILSEPLRQRVAQGQDILTQRLTNIAGDPDQAQSLSEQLANGQAKASPLYQKAFAEGANGVWNPELSRLVNFPVIKNAIKKSYEFMDNDAAQAGASAPPAKPFMFNQDGTVSLLMNPDGSFKAPTLEHWDYVKRGLQSIVNAAKPAFGNTNGDSNLYRSIAPVATTFRNALVNDKTIPSYGPALEEAQKYLSGADAYKVGTSLLSMSKPMDIAATLKSADNYTPDQAKLFQQGVASAWINKIGQIRSGNETWNKFDNPNFRSIVGSVFDPQDSQDLLKHLDYMKAMNALKNQVKGNSSTAQQLEGGHQFSGGHGIIGTVASHLGPVSGGALLGGAGAAYESGMDPKSILAGTTLGALTGAGAKRLNQSTQDRAVAIAKQLVRGLPKDADIANSVPKASPQIMGPAGTALGASLPTNVLPMAGNGARSQDPSYAYAKGGRVSRSEGGATSKRMSHEQLVSRLMQYADKSKRVTDKDTKPLLNAPDELVAKALRVAKANA